MQAVLDRLIDRIMAAKIESEPDHNIFMENVFTESTYRDILANLPTTEHYHFINHPDAVLKDGTITRRLLVFQPKTNSKLPEGQRQFWQQFNAIFSSPLLQGVIVEKFKSRIQHLYGNQFPEMVTVPILYRDYPGYRIGVHTDAPFKIATMQFYLPEDESQLHLGTSFHTRSGQDFSLLKTNPFKPNSAYAFVRTEKSWHSVLPIPANTRERNTLALTIYIKGKEYQSDSAYQ